MRIWFIEDTHLRGWTQLRVMRAMTFFHNLWHDIVLISPLWSPVHQHALSLPSASTPSQAKASLKTFTYDFDDIALHPHLYASTWVEGLSHMDVAICTVHPPRDSFHCSVFAATCIRENHLSTFLVPKTWTIVPSYLPEYYYADDGIRRHVICITEFTKAYLINTYGIPSSHISLIYQWTSLDTLKDEEIWNSLSITAQDLYRVGDSDTFVFLQLGMLEYRKWRDIAIQAFERLHAEYPQTSLMFVGEWPDQEDVLSAIAHSSASHALHLFPFTDQPYLALARCNVLLLPSREKEWLPNVLLEAMAIWKVVIGSDLWGIQEAIKHGQTWFLLTPGDSNELYSYMKTLVQNDDMYTTLATQWQQYVFEHFDEQKQFVSFLSLFEKLLS